MSDTYVTKAERERWITTEAGEFVARWRVVGFAVNDGRWNVHQVAGFEMRVFGESLVPVRTSEGRFLGTFDTDVDAMLAIRDAERMPESVKVLY